MGRATFEGRHELRSLAGGQQPMKGASSRGIGSSGICTKRKREKNQNCAMRDYSRERQSEGRERRISEEGMRAWAMDIGEDAGGAGFVPTISYPLFPSFRCL